ncbi:MAG: FmdB family zinc ribbon protein [Nocardioidaceae bacterium]
MPTYQYACTDCDHAFEQVQSFSEDSLTTCPRCEGRLRKIFNAVGVVFKGSGFYRTDSRADKKSPSAPTPSAKPDTSSASSTGSAGSSESSAPTGSGSAGERSAAKSAAGAA